MFYLRFTFVLPSFASGPEINPRVHILLWRIVSADSRGASRQELVKEGGLNTGKLPQGGLPRVNDSPDMTSAVYLVRKATNNKKSFCYERSYKLCHE